MLSICSVSYTWPMYLSDGKLNGKIIALCSVFVRIDHILLSDGQITVQCSMSKNEIEL